ncbi:purine-cytosine permease family protein [Pseudomonas putida]|jgi:NCS1 family nucleobase:cation symporter-1|uniref:purine-cytosine permease family protein n=2 Tax=Pseudomonadaceae TaxID=135621 RepID=UPI000C9CB708|nr:cytosine permease [Pseudomonas putida]MCI1037270.1 cytosine permease [Pseudomonas putida]PNG82060.1 allantoin permease [Pseudomonas putida]
MKVETRSIEFVPHSERYGRPRRLFTVWFSSNLQVTALMIGTLGVAAGLSLLWTLLGLVIGALVGTVFMAAHSAQGPHLGVPQMIQSRAQFGVFGAAIPLLVMVTAAVLFMAASGVLMRDTLKTLLPVSDNQAIVMIGAATFVIGVVGYELIHRMGAWMTLLSTLVFGTALVLILVRAHSLGSLQFSAGGFSMPVFNLVIAQAASWTLGYGPYVADYSRYLPADVRTRDTFWTTYFGCALGSLGMMALGALLAAVLPSALHLDPGAAIASLFGPWAKTVLVVIVLGVVQYNVLCLYSAYMSSTTIYSGFATLRQVRPATKAAMMAVLSVLACLIATRTQYHFDTFFADILIGQLYLLIPWSAINLVDYYLVQRGAYHIADLYDARGRYGRWNGKTMLVYAVSVIGTVPFMQFSFFEGYVARLIGADVSWLAGLALAGGLYFMVKAPPAVRRRANLANAEE